MADLSEFQDEPLELESIDQSSDEKSVGDKSAVDEGEVSELSLSSESDEPVQPKVNIFHNP